MENDFELAERAGRRMGVITNARTHADIGLRAIERGDTEGAHRALHRILHMCQTEVDIEDERFARFVKEHDARCFVD